MTQPLSSDDISTFLPEICTFCEIKKYNYRLHFNTYFLILLNFYVLKGCFNKHGCNFDDASKIGYSKPF